ncbi:MAG: YgeY family selenium metabolism-linked hydrolase [Calditrichaceae bacterium]|nr:YgeY family selenium metabolism-linked hydrolase [Calditrichia bacterium]NUQ43215.1 YgeY family selenium metabolism-linked hydrolase [Calditrichaceae bacterium]
MNPILKLAQSLKAEVAQFLREIIAIPSLSSREGAVIQRIKAEMEKIGFDEIRIDGLGNLLGRIGGGRRVVAIDSHCDTVDVGNPDLWEVDPFKGDFRDGIIYGRGACDLKGGLASSLYAGKILKQIGMPDDVTLWISCTVQEEDCDGLCWKYIIEEEKFIPGAVLLTEPTNLNIYRGQRGRMEIKVKTEGLSCHGSAPERGVNAVYKMAPIIQEIEELNTRLKDDPFLGKGTVTISEIQSTSPSLCAVADSCTIHLDRRLTAGETIDTALEEIRSLPAFRKAQAKVWLEQYAVPSYTGKVFPMQKYFPTWVLEEHHPLLQTAVESYRELFNANPLVDKWTFSTNGIATMGLHGIPTFGFGPGKEEHAHSPYEQIPVEHLVKAMAFYAGFVRNF